MVVRRFSYSPVVDPVQFLLCGFSEDRISSTGIFFYKTSHDERQLHPTSAMSRWSKITRDGGVGGE